MGAIEAGDELTRKKLPDKSQESTKSEPRFTELGRKELLAQPICKLGLKIEGSRIEKYVAQLYRELSAKGIDFHPPCYLADEWLTPADVPAIGIPFFLVHPKLRRLEKSMMLEVEGGTKDEFMRLLRHECGHAMNHAFLLHRKNLWRKHFGLMSTDYKDNFYVRPYSRKYVRNLDNHYAQMHPEEDFAETFAVWLNPDVDWKCEYASWGALAKLEYVDELMREDVAGWLPTVVAKKKQMLWAVSRMKSTLGAYYKRRRAEYAWDFPDFYDPELMELFAEPASEVEGESAAGFLARHREMLVSGISTWSGDTKYNVAQFLDNLIERADELGLVLRTSKSETLLNLGAYVASVSVNYRHTGKLRHK